MSASVFWHEDQIKALLQRSDRAVERALLALFAAQTHDEQLVEHTLKRNNVGFLPGDAEYMTAWAKQIQAGEPLKPGQLRHLRAGTTKMPERSRIGKYSRQLCELANAKLAEIDDVIKLWEEKYETEVEMADSFEQSARVRPGIEKTLAELRAKRRKQEPRDPTLEAGDVDAQIAMELGQGR